MFVVMCFSMDIKKGMFVPSCLRDYMWGVFVVPSDIAWVCWKSQYYHPDAVHPNYTSQHLISSAAAFFVFKCL